MAPPTVTLRVPGLTMGKRPSGSSVLISQSRLTPACTVALAGGHVEVEQAVEPGGDQNVSPRVLGCVAVTAAKTAGDDASAAGAGHRRSSFGFPSG